MMGNASLTYSTPFHRPTHGDWLPTTRGIGMTSRQRRLMAWIGGDLRRVCGPTRCHCEEAEASWQSRNQLAAFLDCHASLAMTGLGRVWWCRLGGYAAGDGGADAWGNGGSWARPPAQVRLAADRGQASCGVFPHPTPGRAEHAGYGGVSGGGASGLADAAAFVSGAGDCIAVDGAAAAPAKTAQTTQAATDAGVVSDSTAAWGDHLGAAGEGA